MAPPRTRHVHEAPVRGGLNRGRRDCEGAPLEERGANKDGDAGTLVVGVVGRTPKNLVARERRRGCSLIQASLDVSATCCISVLHPKFLEADYIKRKFIVPQVEKGL